MMRYLELDQEKVEDALSVKRRKGCSISKQITQLSQDDLQSLDSSNDMPMETQPKEKSKKRRKACIYDYMNIDFLGVLKDDSTEMRKSKIIEVYRYFFRFSTERMKSLIDNPIMMVILLEYLSKTQMRRVQRSKTLRKNIHNYYKAMENIINVSRYSTIICNIMPQILDHQYYEITVDSTGK